KLPGAKAFKRWVTSEILPTIRRTGGYVNDEELFISTYMPHADDATQQLFRMSLQQIRRLNEKIEHDKPLVDFANYVGKSETLIDMGAMAKLAEKEMENIRIGRNRLFKWLREKGVLMNNNLPYQRYIETGYFQVCDANGGSKEKSLIFPQTMVTGKGQIYLINRLKNEYPEGKSK
ncbi:MAG: phage antirepressor Ant, partial [Ruminococcus sp.]|nr:phage antirepressor Ant [Ruminococcus sp.]